MKVPTIILQTPQSYLEDIYLFHEQNQRQQDYVSVNVYVVFSFGIWHASVATHIIYGRVGLKNVMFVLKQVPPRSPGIILL